MAWHPLTPSWVPLLAVLFGVYVLLETYSFDSSGPDMLRYCALARLDSGYSSCGSLRWLLVAISHISV